MAKSLDDILKCYFRMLYLEIEIEILICFELSSQTWLLFGKSSSEWLNPSIRTNQARFDYFPNVSLKSLILLNTISWDYEISTHAVKIAFMKMANTKYFNDKEVVTTSLRSS
jgi:hypothetical protein